MNAAQTIALKARSQETGKTAPRAARPRRLSARRLLLAGAAIVAIAGASDYGWYYWATGRFEVSTDDAYVKADSTIIAPKVGSYLSEVRVRDNQPVKAGQVLAKIDDRDYVVALAQARADVAAAQGEIENISATIDHQQAVIAQEDGTVAVDKATLISPSRTMPVIKIWQAAATLARDEAALRAAQVQTKILRAQLEEANAALEQRRAIAQQAHHDHGAGGRSGGKPDLARRAIRTGRHQSHGDRPDRTRLHRRQLQGDAAD
jgi:membrane fusion protein, multidrug efflux system